METKGILRMVLRVLGMVFVVILSMGSSCDKKENPAGPAGPGPNQPDILVYIGTDSPGICVSGCSYSFGQVSSGQTKTLNVQINNNGTAELKYKIELTQNPPYNNNPITASGFPIGSSEYPYNCSFWPGGGTLQPNDACMFKVTYELKNTYCEERKDAAIVTIWSNDPDTPEYLIFLNGSNFAMVTGCAPNDSKQPDTGTGTGTGTGTRSGGGTRSGQYTP